VSPIIDDRPLPLTADGGIASSLSTLNKLTAIAVDPAATSLPHALSDQLVSNTFEYWQRHTPNNTVAMAKTTEQLRLTQYRVEQAISKDDNC
jgi:hypothetical protein